LRKRRRNVNNLKTLNFKVPNLKEAKRHDDDAATSAFLIEKGFGPTKRLWLAFNNGLALSIIQGYFTYGGKQGLFEIAPMTENSDWAPWLFDEDDKGDDVLGHCDAEKVQYYINKIANMKKEEYLPLLDASSKDE